MDDEEDFQLPGIPKPLPSDHEDVSWALSTSRTMWARGEHREAIKWLRRSAEAAADQEGDAQGDARALELAKAAADLAALIANGSPTESNPPPPVISKPPPPPLRPAIEDLSDVALLEGDSTLQGMPPMKTQPMAATSPSGPPPPAPAAGSRPSQFPPRAPTAPLASTTGAVRPSQAPVAPRVGTQRTQPLNAFPSAPPPAIDETPSPPVAQAAAPSAPGSSPNTAGRARRKSSANLDGEARSAKDILRDSLAKATRAIPGAADANKTALSPQSSPATTRSIETNTPSSSFSRPATPAAFTPRTSSPPPAVARPLALTVPHGAALGPIGPAQGAIPPHPPTAKPHSKPEPVPPPPETDPVPNFDRTTETPALGADDVTVLGSVPLEASTRPSGKERVAKPRKRTKSRGAFDDSDVTVMQSPSDSDRALRDRDSITNEHPIASGPVPPPSSRPVERSPLIGTPRAPNASQAIRVVLWKDASGVHVAPVGTVVNAIGVEAMLVALDPTADLNAWLESKPHRGQSPKK